MRAARIVSVVVLLAACSSDPATEQSPVGVEDRNPSAVTKSEPQQVRSQAVKPMVVGSTNLAADEQLKVEDGPIAIARGERILLVEDNPNVREVVRYQLEALGYAVIEADGGPAAIKTLAAAPAADIDLVLSDVVMAGGMSGFDVARWIATNRPSLGIVLASGYPDDVLKAEMTDWRETRLLRKPFSRAELARTLRQVLDRQ